MKNIYPLCILLTLLFWIFEKSEAQQSNSSYTLSLPATTNYIHTLTPEEAMQSVPGNSVSHDIQKLDEEVQYFDGLGRPLQNVSVKASPAGKDIVQPFVYDEYGRESDKYLPFTLQNNNGALVTNPIDASSGQKAFYEGLFTGEGSNAKSHIVYEPSPLNRILKQGAPGATWQPNSDLTRATPEHVISIGYQANTTTDNVARWEVNSSDECIQNGAYDVGTLYVTQTTDENTHAVKEYKDKEGRVILKSVDDGSAWLRTYYVYDDFGWLRFVLPPKAVLALAGTPDIEANAEIVTASKTITKYVGKSYFLQPGVTLTLGSGFHFASANDSTFRVAPVSTVSKTDVLNQLAYQYTYDDRNRMIAKKLPGADWVYMVYDKRDRLVLTQDGKMRAENNKQWLFTKYNALNQPVMTGTYIHNTAVSQAAMQSVVDQFYVGSGKYYEESGTAVHGYTNQSFPSVANANDYLTVTYYDTYGFPGKQGFDGDFNISEYSDTEGDIRYFDTPKGIVTGTKTKVLDTDIWLTSTIYYDDKYRAIQTQRELYDGSNGGKEIVSTLYDFVGKVKQTRQKQTFGSDATTAAKVYSHDHAGRLLKVTQQIERVNPQPVTINEMTYNELGQLQQKKLGGVQNIDYQYNIRGWLTQINDPDNLGTDLFGMKLLYNEPGSLGAQAQFNGNISGMVWKNKKENDPVKGYTFGYDALNRLTGSNYKTAASGTWNESSAFEEKSITYDANGNINQLIRTGDTGNELANYSYHYTGNQLADVNSGTAYKYDLNGNATKDGVRGFDISYNQLNLPKTISKGTENISYIYTASGEKVAKKMKNNKYQYYAGNFVYHDNKLLDYLLFEEGKVNRQEDGSLVYDYFIKDHLGNTRAAFSQGGTNVRVTEYYPFGMDYGTSSRDAKYLYNGKELQDDKLNETALDWYDYGARFYDPQIGRFHTIDRFAEKYLDLTPYHYAANNPIMFIDVNGDSLAITQAMLDNNQFAAAFKQFMGTKQGMAFLSKFAAKGQTILGHTFDKDGDYSAKGIDLKYDAKDLGDGDGNGVTRANTGNDIKENGRLGIGITLNTNEKAASIDENGTTVGSFNQRVYESTENLFHESFIHGSMDAKDFLDNGKMDYSNISQAAKNAAGPSFKNQYQHFQVIMDFQNYGYKSRNLWPAAAYYGLYKVNQNLKTNNSAQKIVDKMWHYEGGR